MTLVESYAEARYCGESDDVSTYAPFAKHAELMQAVTALITERDALRTKDEAQAATIKRLQLYENLAAEYGLSAFPDMAALRARVTELGIALIEQTALTNAAIAAAKEPK